MAKVMVYEYRRYDLEHAPSTSHRCATLQAIDGLHRCVPILHTGREVDEKSLDSQGFLVDD